MLRKDKTPDLLDCIYIKKEADLIVLNNPSIRYGQAVFNVSYKYFPVAADHLRGTYFDCYYEDSKVDLYLQELQQKIVYTDRR